MACNCVRIVNEKLAEHNTRLSIPIIFGGGPTRLMVRTEEVAKVRGKKAVTMFASFCPFCGTKYDEAGRLAEDEASDDATGANGDRRDEQ